ncbi:response regulator [Chitinivibrio alkaliphilus]|uniref:Response regulator receiver protein n=1 Tax=Chitinivibrio alkaliphilus ACht1 TaxID=1313304 RepID=U7DAL3_9BACT|nr:response regulator [Chitinivibrio alkaliphilus]ERP31435.1 response regulator receiver protein [Chitinivibrio alkaliphilus ACht1]
MGKILFVDDEKSILNSLKRVFFGLSQYEPLFMDDPEDALECVREGGIHVVVSDIKMPQMSGIAVLDAVREIDPDIVRIALSGNAEMQDIIEAVNRGDIWRYIDKPWDRQKLLMTMKNALELFDKKKESKRLFLALEEKKSELEKINRNLESMVAMRTKLLEERTRIMNLIINDEPLETVFRAVAENLVFFGKARVVQINSPYLEATFIYPADAQVDQVVTEGEFNKAGFSVQGDCTVVSRLRKNRKNLGYLMLKDIDKKDISELYPIIETFANLVIIYLYQQKTLADLPRVLQQLDSIIESS